MTPEQIAKAKELIEKAPCWNVELTLSYELLSQALDALEDARREIEELKANRDSWRKTSDAQEQARNILRSSLERLEAENANLRMALEKTREAIEADECRSDEDCDHCHIVNELINPALSSAPSALLDRMKKLKKVADVAKHFHVTHDGNKYVFDMTSFVKIGLAIQELEKEER